MSSLITRGLGSNSLVVRGFGLSQYVIFVRFDIFEPTSTFQLSTVDSVLDLQTLDEPLVLNE